MASYQSRADNPGTADDESLLYEPETLHASYGCWLAVNAGDNTQWDVGAFSTSLANDSNLDVSTVGTADNGLEDSATYSGSAVGMPCRTMGSGEPTEKMLASNGASTHIRRWRQLMRPDPVALRPSSARGGVRARGLRQVGGAVEDRRQGTRRLVPMPAAVRRASRSLACSSSHSGHLRTLAPVPQKKWHVSVR